MSSLDQRLVEMEKRAEAAESRIAALEQASVSEDTVSGKSQRDELHAANLAVTKLEYRVKHLLRYVEELERKVDQEPLRVANSKLEYRLKHVLLYVQELEAHK